MQKCVMNHKIFPFLHNFTFHKFLIVDILANLLEEAFAYKTRVYFNCYLLNDRAV